MLPGKGVLTSGEINLDAAIDGYLVKRKNGWMMNESNFLPTKFLTKLG